MNLRPFIQSIAEQLAVERRCFVSAPWWRRRKARDELLLATAYGVQNCLRSLAMQFPASVDRSPQGQDPAEGLGRNDESAVPERQTPKDRA